MKYAKKISPNMSFNDWCDYWLETTNYSRGLTTNAQYGEIISRIIQPAFTGKILSRVEYDEIQSFVDSLNVKASRSSMIKAILNMIMQGAVDHNLITRNPAALTLTTKSTRKDIAILNDDDIKALLALKNESVYVRALLFTLFLGLRIGETLGLSWDNIDIDNGNVTISQQLTSYYKDGKTHQVLLPYTKTRKNRTLPLPEVAQELLIEQKNFYTENPDRLVFTEKNGKAIIYASFYYQFNKLMYKIGRNNVTPHSLRHTTATTLLYSTKDIFLVKEVLGHRSLNTTVHYPTVSLQERQEAAKALDEYFAVYMKEVKKTCL